MARRFLYIVATLVVLFMLGLLGLNHWARELSQLAFTPSVAFSPPPPLPPHAYDDPALWLARGTGNAQDPVRFVPRGLTPAFGEPASLDAAVFFIHPTSYFSRRYWNARADEPSTREANLAYMRGLASPFNAARAIWAPRYRQATLGAFLTDKPQGRAAIDAAYADVLAAFDIFIASTPYKTPIVLVGHSQGARHLMRLLQDRVAGRPLASRIAAAYVIGWPVSLPHDLPAMGLPACSHPDESGCVIGWQSYGEPADPSMLLHAYDASPGLDGASRKGTPFLCTNPLTGTPGATAPASANLGTLVPDASLVSGALVAGLVPARCNAQGLLLIGQGPDLGRYVMPGNNYHLYDIPLFWANTRADMARRIAAWRKAN